MKKTFKNLTLIAFLGAMIFSGCSKNELEPQSTQEVNTPNMTMRCHSSGTVQLDSAVGYLDFIQLREVGTGNLVTIWNTGEWFDLLHMETGIMGDIGFLQIPAGLYDRAICHVTHGWAYENGVKTYVKFPGNKMVMKFMPPAIVGEHLSEEFDIEVNIDNSFKKAGNKYIFSPLVKVTNNTTDGRFVGGVIDALGTPLIGATITLSNGTDTYQTTSFAPIPELGDLMFQITDVPAGSYSASASYSGSTSGTANITIVEGNYNSHLFVIP